MIKLIYRGAKLGLMLAGALYIHSCVSDANSTAHMYSNKKQMYELKQNYDYKPKKDLRDIIDTYEPSLDKTKSENIKNNSSLTYNSLESVLKEKKEF